MFILFKNERLLLCEKTSSLKILKKQYCFEFYSLWGFFIIFNRKKSNLSNILGIQEFLCKHLGKEQSMSILFKWTSHKQNAVIWILLQLGALRINPPCEQYCFLLEQKWQNQEIQNSVIFKRNVDVSQKWNWSILLSSWRVLKNWIPKLYA